MFASVCPAGMVFVPSVGGISHNPAEQTSPVDLVAGANVLLQVVLAARRERRDPGPMSRTLSVAAAQLGPIAREESRAAVVVRLLALLHEAHGRGAELVAFPELALTTFFPRWYFEDQADIDAFFETEMPGPDTKRLFDEAARLGVGFCLGYAEMVTDDNDVAHHYNAEILVDRAGGIVVKYRKVHLPGHEEYEPWRPFQHLERRYFESGPDGFGVWRAFDGVVGMAICNDRRWPETYRVLGLQGVELVLIGYNTPIHYVPDPSQDAARGLSQPARDAVRRVSERHVGGGRRQGGLRGRGRRPCGVVHHRPLGRDRRGVRHGRRRGRGRPRSTSTRALRTSKRCSTSIATVCPSTTG